MPGFGTPPTWHFTHIRTAWAPRRCAPPRALHCDNATRHHGASRMHAPKRRHVNKKAAWAIEPQGQTGRSPHFGLVSSIRSRGVTPGTSWWLCRSYVGRHERGRTSLRSVSGGTCGVCISLAALLATLRCALGHALFFLGLVCLHLCLACLHQFGDLLVLRGVQAIPGR